MIRGITLFALATTLAAAAAQAAEVVGTIVSTDPTARTFVVMTPEGREVVYRTVETTRIQQGDTTVDLKNLQQGSHVQIITAPPPAPASPPSTGTTVVYPVASGIVISPAPAPSVSAPPPPPSAGRSEPRKTDIDVDVDKDVDEDD